MCLSEAWVALYGKWRNRHAPCAPRTSWAVVWQEVCSSLPAAPYRLRGKGQWEAAALLEDQGLMEAATSVVFERRQRGWEPLLPSEMPSGLVALGSMAPPLLWSRGESSFVTQECVAIVGSRTLFPEEASFAKAAGRWCAHKELGIVSGGANGSDRFAAEESLMCGGRVAHFLPGGECEKGDATILTADPDGPEFNRLEALRRNRWIYASAQMAVLVASRYAKGGSWSGAMISRREKLAPVAVFIGKEPSDGNAALARLGFATVSSADELDEFRNEVISRRQRALDFENEQPWSAIAE